MLYILYMVWQYFSFYSMESSFGFADVDGESGLAIGLVAFTGLADELRKYSKGDVIRVAGQFRENNYQKTDGTKVEGFQVTIESLAGIKAAGAKYPYLQKA